MKKTFKSELNGVPIEFLFTYTLSLNDKNMYYMENGITKSIPITEVIKISNNIGLKEFLEENFPEYLL